MAHNHRNVACFTGFILIAIALGACQVKEIETTSTVILPTATLAESTATRTPEATPTITPAAFQQIAVSAPDCNYGGKFKSIETLDEYTVRFTLCSPEPAFLVKIASPAFGIQPREYLEQTGGDSEGSPYLRQPVGTGPYRLVEWKEGEQFVFESFESYWGEKPKASKLIFRWNTDAASRLLELQAGSVDGIDAVSPDDYANVEGDRNLKLYPRTGLNVYYLGINTKAIPFDKEEVRQAVAMAIDRKQILLNYFQPGTVDATHFTPCIVPNGCAGEDWYDFNPAWAKEIMTTLWLQDGFKAGLAFQNVPNVILTQPNLVAQDIQRQLLNNLNINIGLKEMSASDFQQAAANGELPGLFLGRWEADFPDMTDFLDPVFISSEAIQFGDRLDDLHNSIQTAAGLAGDELRQPYYEAANNLIRQHALLIPLAHGGSSVAFLKTVEGAHASPVRMENFALMSTPGQDTLTWLQDGEPASLYCADELDNNALRACAQVVETLYRYKAGSAVVEPALVETCVPDRELKVWTCRLRQGVFFHDGSILDAGDVVMSFVLQWDASNLLHKGDFTNWKSLWGSFLNQR
jgi:peptide/nickel transport system substrate-binding protein